MSPSTLPSHLSDSILVYAGHGTGTEVYWAGTVEAYWQANAGDLTYQDVRAMVESLADCGVHLIGGGAEAAFTILLAGATLSTARESTVFTAPDGITYALTLEDEGLFVHVDAPAGQGATIHFERNCGNEGWIKATLSPAWEPQPLRPRLGAKAEGAAAPSVAPSGAKEG